MMLRKAPIRSFTIERSNNTVVSIYPLGDIHVGAKGFDEQRFKQYVDRIAADPLAYWIGLGDYADLITTKDPRSIMNMYEPGMYSPAALADPGAWQRDRVLEVVEPIRHKCLGLVPGNHETKFLKHTQRDVFREIVAGISPHVPEDWRDSMRFDYEQWLILRFLPEGSKTPTSTCVLWLFHGAGGGMLRGAKALRQQRRAWKHSAAHAVIAGHVHEEMAFPEVVYNVDVRSGNVLPRKIHTVISGSFKWSKAQRMGWAVEKEFPEQLPGTPWLELRPFMEQRISGTRLFGFNHPDAIRVIV